MTLMCLCVCVDNKQSPHVLYIEPIAQRISLGMYKATLWLRAQVFINQNMMRASLDSICGPCDAHTFYSIAQAQHVLCFSHRAPYRIKTHSNFQSLRVNSECVCVSVRLFVGQTHTHTVDFLLSLFFYEPTLSVIGDSYIPRKGLAVHIYRECERMLRY